MAPEQVTMVTQDDKDSAYKMLRETFGCIKGPVKRLTKEEKNQIAEDLCNNLDKQDEIFREFGL